jgi:hypothetical protein
VRARARIRSRVGRRTPLLVGGAVLAVAVAACSGENLFTAPGTGGAILLGPEVNITAPLPNISIPPGDSVEVIATLVSSEGINEVSWTGTLDAGGAAPFAPIVVPLGAVMDTTMSRYLKRSGTTGGGAKIIVTAKDLSGDLGADTISVTLGG